MHFAQRHSILCRGICQATELVCMRAGATALAHAPRAAAATRGARRGGRCRSSASGMWGQSSHLLGLRTGLLDDQQGDAWSRLDSLTICSVVNVGTGVLSAAGASDLLAGLLPAGGRRQRFHLRESCGFVPARLVPQSRRHCSTASADSASQLSGGASVAYKHWRVSV